MKKDLVLNKLFFEDVSNFDFSSLEKDYLFLYYLYNGKIEEAKEIFFEIDIDKSNYSQELKVIKNILFDDICNELILNSNDPIVNKYNSLINKYIKLNAFDVVSVILTKLYNYTDDIFNFIYTSAYKTRKSNLKYINEFLYVLDDVTKNGLSKMEIELLFYLEIEDYSKVDELLLKLEYIYGEDSLITNVINMLYIRKKLILNSRMINNSNYSGAYGSFYDILSALLEKGDYYRAYELINDNKNNIISIDIYMCEILMDRIITLVKNNEKNVYRTISSSLASDNEQEIISMFPINSLHIDIIKEKEESDISHLDDTDYYALYKEYYEKKDFINAKKSLLNHIKIMKSLEIAYDYDYLISELDTLIEIYDDNQVNIKKYEYYKNKSELSETLADKIYFLKESMIYSVIPNPRDYAQIASLYMENKDYSNAYLYYMKAERYYLFPKDYLNVMECLYYLGNYSSVIEYVSKYEYYYPNENTFVYYLESICFAYMGDYESAYECLDKVVEINYELNDVNVSLSYEKNIINGLYLGYEIPIFGLDTYIDYSLNKEEEMLEEEIKKDDNIRSIVKRKLLKDNNVNEKIDYLLSVVKVLYRLDKADDAFELLQFIDSLLSDKDIDYLSKTNSKVLAYKSNYIYI